MSRQLKLFLSVDGLGDRSVQVGEAATAGELLDALGAEQAGGLAVSRTGLVLQRPDPVLGSDIRSGDRIALLSDPNPSPSATMAGPARSRTWRPAAVVKVLSGPAAPVAIEIPFGQTSIGRGHDNDISIPDKGMSRHHASIRVDDDSVEVIDNGSANGVLVNDERRTGQFSLQAGQRALFGHTWIEVEHLGRPQGLGDLGQNNVEFNRPPRLVQPYQPQKFAVPAPPDHPPKQRIPKAAAVAPLFMGAAMIYMPTLISDRPPNYLFGMFMLFSPIMMLASFFENRTGARANFREAKANFETAVETLVVQLEEAHDAEQRGRRKAAPSVGELPAIVESLSPRLWERALRDSDVLSVRIGLADQPSQNQIEMNDKGAPDLREMIVGLPDRFGTVDQVPAIADLVEGPGLGISGPREFALPMGHAVVSQLASLHTPAELLLAAMIPESDRHEWDWMKWLPHCPPDDSALGGRPLASGEIEVRGLLHRLLGLISQRMEAQTSSSQERNIPAPAIVVAIGEGVPLEQHELTNLLEVGPAVGVFAVWVAGASRRVPRPLGNVVQIDRSGRMATLGITRQGREIHDVGVELLDPQTVLALARRLSPIEDVSARFTTASNIPSRVSLIDIIGGTEVRDATDIVLDRWQARPKTLEAPVGRTAEGIITLDIRRDGPHALVGGTTGAGKSEFLQTWVMGMAAMMSPHTVSFLLVDYKGGAAFKDCAKLPHTVGMVTDLDKAGVRRSLVSLEAELHHRETILAKHNCSDLLQMIDEATEHAPPSLLIIVDEFAALVQEVPEFVDGVVAVAQRGRSLGLHLVLATQRPAGIITGQVKSNTDLRIALRMADVEDSNDVIESPAAAEIGRDTPGRGIVSISRKRTPFQSGYVGGYTDDGDTGPGIEVAMFDFEGVRPLPAPQGQQKKQEPKRDETDNDLELLVANLQKAHDQTGLELPRKPWLAPLETLYDLADLTDPSKPSPGATTDELILGMVDVPHHQAQVPLKFDPDADGSLGIIGAGGSGKTVALRTICASVASHDLRPEETPIIYVFDFAGRGMRMVDELPHVAGVVADDEPERAQRVLTDLESLLETRTEAFAQVLASSLPEFRKAKPDEPISRIVLLVDGYPTFHEMFEPIQNEKYIRLFRRLIQEGRPVGIHVVLTAPRRDTIMNQTARTLNRWLILRQTSIDDYRSLEVPNDILDEESPPGRLIEDKNVAQVAVLGGSSATEVQAQAMGALADRLRAMGVPDAPEIKLLPEVVSRKAIKNARSFGIRDRDFGEQAIPDRFKVMLVTGPRSSGRSTALVTLGLAASSIGYDEVIFMAPKAPTVPVHPKWRQLIGFDDINEFLFSIVPQATDDQKRLLLVDDSNGLTDMGAPLDQAVENCDGTNLAMVVVMEDNKARSSFDPFARAVTANKLGILLRASPMDDADVFGVPLPRIRSHLWPVGRGYLVDDTSLEVVQVAG